jgi:hypothetical protein
VSGHQYSELPGPPNGWRFSCGRMPSEAARSPSGTRRREALAPVSCKRMLGSMSLEAGPVDLKSSRRARAAGLDSRHDSCAIQIRTPTRQAGHL